MVNWTLPQLALAASIAYEKTVKKVAQDTQPAKHEAWAAANRDSVLNGNGAKCKSLGNAPSGWNWSSVIVQPETRNYGWQASEKPPPLISVSTQYSTLGRRLRLVDLGFDERDAARAGASQSETFVKPALQKAKTSREANRLIGPPRAKGSKCFLLTGRLYWLLCGGWSHQLTHPWYRFRIFICVENEFLPTIHAPQNCMIAVSIPSVHIIMTT